MKIRVVLINIWMKEDDYLSKASNIKRDKVFLQLLKNSRLPEPEKEFKFHPKRKWRFDFAYPDKRIAIEIDGGIWSRGRHVNPQGFINDCEKTNAAGKLGWRVLRIPSNQIHYNETIKLIKETYHFDMSVQNYSKQESIFRG